MKGRGRGGGQKSCFCTLVPCVVPAPHVQGLPPECPLSVFHGMGMRRVTQLPSGRTGPRGLAATGQPLNWSPCLRPTVRSPWVTSKPFWNSVLQAGTGSRLVPATLTSLRSARSVCFAVLAAPFLSLCSCVLKTKSLSFFHGASRGSRGVATLPCKSGGSVMRSNWAARTGL